MRGFLLDENRAGVNLNSAGRMVSLFATEKNQHFVKCLCEFSFLLDRKFIAQQRNIIFFSPKPTPLIEPFEQRRDGSPSCDGPDSIGKKENAIIGQDTFDFAQNTLERVVGKMMPDQCLSLPYHPLVAHTYPTYELRKSSMM
jgi:hypothetical protein